uniref:Putative tm816 triabin-like lipocalin n=1 Tax=Panstrongylus lignarius TaxID=156445 RepID=A0A224XX67_9HEMI
MVFCLCSLIRIFGVTFFGILTFAFADATDLKDLKDCRHPRPMSNFDSKNFLTSTWYVTHALLGSNSTVCRRYKTSLTGDTIKLDGDGYYTISEDLTLFTKVRCKGLKNKTEHCGKLSLACKQTGEELERTIKFELDVTILETDYTKFAVMYRCVKFPLETGILIEDNVLVLHRTYTIKNELDPKISETLEKQELDLDEFRSRKGVKCQRRPKKNKVKK